MVELTHSHQTLTIRLERHGQVGNLEIACLEPTFIHGPTNWDHAGVTVEHGTDGYIVIDINAGVRIETGKVELAENRKPFNKFTIPNEGWGHH